MKTSKKADTNSKPESAENEPPPIPHLEPFTRLLVYNVVAYHRGNLVINLNELERVDNPTSA
jgi:hypothetical protein